MPTDYSIIYIGDTPDPGYSAFAMWSTGAPAGHAAGQPLQPAACRLPASAAHSLPDGPKHALLNAAARLSSAAVLQALPPSPLPPLPRQAPTWPTRW